MLTQRLLKELEGIVGKEHLLTEPEHRATYSYDATPFTTMPEAVVLPGSTQEVAQILKLANESPFSVVVRGSGTSLAGSAVPSRGSVVMATSRLNRILDIDQRNFTARAQPGVVLAQFQQAVQERGLFYPPDPASNRVATLGGSVATNAGGLRCVKYGTTRDYVLGLEVVLPTGEVVHTGGQTVKNVAGYDLTRLLVGSEGTLGVVTEVTVRLLPLPEARRTCLAVFDAVEQAGEAVVEILLSKVIPRALELLDQNSIHHIEDFRPSGLPLDCDAVLLIEVDGSQEDVKQQMEKVTGVCRATGAREVRVAHTEAQAEELWAGRRAHYAALARVRPSIIVEDICVPRALLPQAIKGVRELARKHRVQIGLAAHAGDGNLHPDIMCDLRDEEEMARVRAFIEGLFHLALQLGGTITGEHGVGTMKMPYLAWQYGEEGLEAMRRIKRALDPRWILNPGKVLDVAS